MGRQTVDSQFAVVPAAIGMMLGPQILTSIVLATSKKPRPNSFAFVAGAALGSAAGLAVAYLATSLIDSATDDLEQGDDLLIYLVVALLLYLSVKTFLGRRTAEPPAWMGTLQDAEPRLSFRLGLLLVSILPANIIILLSAATYLVDNDYLLIDGLSLVVTTTLFAALPVLAIVVFGSRADQALPGIREWMKANSWLISIVVYLFFIYALLS